MKKLIYCVPLAYVYVQSGYVSNPSKNMYLMYGSMIDFMNDGRALETT
jgi:hypothetical protein